MYALERYIPMQLVRTSLRKVMVSFLFLEGIGPSSKLHKKRRKMEASKDWSLSANPLNGSCALDSAAPPPSTPDVNSHHVLLPTWHVRSVGSNFRGARTLHQIVPNADGGTKLWGMNDPAASHVRKSSHLPLVACF